LAENVANIERKMNGMNELKDEKGNGLRKETGEQS
jgi:hypothetical protein